MKQYKHKQTNKVVTSDKNGFYYGEGNFCLDRRFIENTQDWELIPETPKMEIVENIQSMYSILSGVPRSNKNYYLIKNPTPEIKAILKAVEDGKAYEYFVGKLAINALKNGEPKFNDWYIYKDKKDLFPNINGRDSINKILIIPITENEPNHD